MEPDLQRRRSRDRMDHQIEPDTRANAEQILGYHFRDEHLLAQALTHASVADGRLYSNERLEFLGDAILGMVVCEHLFHEYPDLLEGEMTKIKSAVVSRKTCAQISDDLGLTSLLTLGKGMHGRQEMPSSLGAAVYEALVAAIYLDGGIEPTRRFILRHMADRIDTAAESAHQFNFKSVLQQHCQKRMEELPSYVLLDEKGPDHSKAFQVCAEISGQRFEPAWGASKKQAEQSAALLALQEMGLAQVDQRGRIQLSEELLEST